MKWCLPQASLPEGKGPAVDITGATTGVSVAEETIDADVTVDNNVTADDPVVVTGDVAADVTAVNNAINGTRISTIVIELFKILPTQILNRKFSCNYNSKSCVTSKVVKGEHVK